MLEAAVLFQVYQRPGEAAVVVFQKIDGLLVGNAALLPEDFNIFDGVLCHSRLPPWVGVWKAFFLLTMLSYHRKAACA